MEIQALWSVPTPYPNYVTPNYDPGDYFVGADTSKGDGVRFQWQAWYSGSGFESDPRGGESSNGTSFHLTSLPQASATLAFHGVCLSIRLRKA
jgi:hypothetical protein